MKKDLPFYIALILAMLLHLAAGMGLKYSRLLAAIPAPSAAPQTPVTLKFVEVPPNATSVPQAPPKAQHFSDQNRIAGPLKPNGPKRMVVQQPTARPGGRPGSPPPAPAPPQGSVARNTQQRPAQVPEISDQGPSISAPGSRQLTQSLQNLDRYIPSGTGNGAGGADGDGSLPTGDPGSGVFFDTQGYDLGPWANRAVEIVRSNWIIPVAAELGMKGVVGISFKIDRNGNILDLKIVSPSGIPSFDQAALRALQSSSPLPELPADFPRPMLPGVFRFYYNTPVPPS